MKKQKITRVLAMLLALAMLVGLTACAGGGESSSSTASGSGESSDDSSGETAAEDGPLTPYEEPVKITWAVQASAVQQFMDGDTYDDNVWSRLIKEKLNIELEVAFSADTSTDAYKQKMNVLLASGEFPDVLRWSDRTFFKQAQDAGYIQPIGPSFDAYATDAVKAYQTNYAEAFEGATIDGVLYAFPYMNDNFHQAYNLWIRDDWLENTNTTPPTTVEEMVELARIFTEEDPDGNGIDDTYGFGLAGSVVQNNYGTISGLANAYGVPGFNNTGIFFRNDEGEMTFAWIQPEMKEVLSIVRDMYAKGYIDPEFTAFLMDAAERSGVRSFLYTSSTAAMGPLRDGMDETAPLLPGDLYGATKASAEMYLMGFNQYYDGQGIYGRKTSLRRNTIRPGYTFSNPAFEGGASQSDVRFKRIAEAVLKNEPITVDAMDGTQFISGRQIAQLYLKILESDLDKEVFLALGTKFVSWGDIARMTKALVPDSASEIIEAGRREKPAYYGVEKMERVFGLRFDGDEDLQEHVAWNIDRARRALNGEPVHDVYHVW